VILVAGGVACELGAGFMIESKNTALRAIDIQLRSKNAALRSKSDQLVGLLHKQTAELEARVAWRRLAREQSVIAGHLKQFPGTRVGISLLGGTPEASQFADDIAAALHAAQ
jgi:hypothetical protein